MDELKPRWRTSFILSNPAHRVFLGYAGDLDVWCNYIEDEVFYVSAEENRKLYSHRAYNFDGFKLVNGVLVALDETPDLNLTPYDMCLIYELLQKKGYLNG